MKKVLLLIGLMVFVSCNSETDYKKKLSSTISLLNRESAISAVIIDSYYNVWKEAIYDNEYNGEYCSDFNKALAKHKEFILSSEVFKDLAKKKDSIETIMPLLKDYPSKYKDAYNEIVSIYADADALFRYAEEPSGSLSSYSEKTSDLFEKITKEVKEFRVKYTNN